MYRKRERVAVDGLTAYVSGAASGIGRAVAQRLSAHGCPVAIVDQNSAGLEETATAMSGPVFVRTLDVSDRHATLAVAAEVAEWAPAPLGMVFNNAGVATVQTVADAAIEDDDWVWLRQELRGTGVRAVTVHPGGVKTNIVRNARYHSAPLHPELTKDEMVADFDMLARTTPERAAQTIHNGVKAGRARILIGPDAYMFEALSRLAPTHYYDVLERGMLFLERRQHPDRRSAAR